MVRFNKIYLYLIYHDIRFQESIEQFSPPEEMVFVQDLSTIRSILSELSRIICEHLYDAYSSAFRKELLQLFEEETLHQVFTDIRQLEENGPLSVHQMWVYDGSLIDIFNNVANYAYDIGSSHWKNDDIRSIRSIYYLRIIKQRHEVFLRISLAPKSEFIQLKKRLDDVELDGDNQFLD
ncbi:MAG: hypothetical protein EZS28_012365 [Streblomastix strix]|uniref:Uncharacterized protein n=1 Tax=Streblomastix strix TaxID=222440 RepID=A0A5J4WCK5_9EUKA|nr:MAG: hypothetical protein EZS28_012365 [Streblomastix strix]